MEHHMDANAAMRTQYRPASVQPAQKDFTNLAICASPSDRISSPARRRKQQLDPESLAAMLRRGIVEHQLGLSVNLILLAGFSYLLFPSLRDQMSAFFGLSYSVGDGLYSQGPRDLLLMLSFIVMFTAVRAVSLDYLLMPLAGACGIAKQKGRVRFAEQSYMMVYYALYWSWGVLLFIHNTPAEVHDVRTLLISLWSSWPQIYLEAGLKLYYLSQLAFWIQQIIVIHIEDRRKDHWQMLAHHIITISLLALSYPFRQWRVGNAILVCMDLVDFIFPLAKILRYLSLQTACDAAFGVFVVTWFTTRHVFYGAICWSLYYQVGNDTLEFAMYSTADGTLVSSGGGEDVFRHIFQPFLYPSAQTVAFNGNVRGMFFCLLGALQCITIVWFFMIMRVVLKVIRGHPAEDTRSDGEDEDEEVTNDAHIPAQPSDHDMLEHESPPSTQRFIEVESTSEEFAFSTRRGSGKRKSKAKGISSGLNLNGHKEILNRIGCLSEEQLARERERRGEGPSGGSSGTGI